MPFGGLKGAPVLGKVLRKQVGEERRRDRFVQISLTAWAMVFVSFERLPGSVGTDAKIRALLERPSEIGLV